MKKKLEKIVRKIRKRWQKLPVTDRPALAQPQNAVLLLKGDELAKLSAGGLWPLPGELVEFIKSPALP